MTRKFALTALAISAVLAGCAAPDPRPTKAQIREQRQMLPLADPMEIAEAGTIVWAFNNTPGAVGLCGGAAMTAACTIGLNRAIKEYRISRGDTAAEANRKVAIWSAMNVGTTVGTIGLGLAATPAVILGVGWMIVYNELLQKDQRVDFVATQSTQGEVAFRVTYIGDYPTAEDR